MKKILSFYLLVSIFFSLNLFAAKTVYLSYEEIPKKVYKNQRFEVVLKALITTPNFDDLTISTFDSKNITLLNDKPTWEKVSNNVYESKLYFKVYEENFQLPKFKVTKIKGFEIVETAILDSKKIIFSNIGLGNDKFTGIIASQLNLKAYKTKQYNNKEALTLVDIDASYSNLEDFKINGIEEQGISKLDNDEYPNQNLVYYFVTPVYEKKVVFSYFNIDTKKYENVVIPLILQNELVSTQTDLNPNDSTYEKYKKIGLAVVLVIFIILSILKRKKLIYFITFVLFIISIFYLMPYKSGYVKKDAYIYILPTKNSTVFFKADEKLEVDVLGKKDDFIKVMGKEKKFIGWIKEDTFGKN